MTIRLAAFVLSLIHITCIQLVAGGSTNVLNEPDSVYLFSYATNRNNGHNGLHFAWSIDKKNWFIIGNDHGFLKSDFGQWGKEKRLVTPYLFLDQNGMWHCVFSVNERDHYFAHVGSNNLVDWGRQSYPQTQSGGNFLEPVIEYDKTGKQYLITHMGDGNAHYRLTTKDFKFYSSPVLVSADQYHNDRVEILLPTGKEKGQVHFVPYRLVEGLVKSYQLKQYANQLYSENAQQDTVRFSGLRPVKVTITVTPDQARPISAMLMGIFFEDINYAADGGLYAELIQNRDFEYRLSDKGGRDKEWTSKHSWSVAGEADFHIDSVKPVHRNNPNYAVFHTKRSGSTLINSGFGGIVTRKGEKYNFSLFARHGSPGPMKAEVRLVGRNGERLSRMVITVPSREWKKIQASLTATADAEDVKLEIEPLAEGELHLDMISLFPQNTFKGRNNGLRADLAQAIADIHPKFVRFPGGCVAHGDGINNIYRWDRTIGPLEARTPQRNLWGYHQTVGLGYFEYFQFCEDIDAEPVPVVAAAVPCQNSATGGPGQQGGVPMEEMDEYIQHIFDLVEYANGDVNSKWGRMRAQAGHPKPFNLKYIGIGNEDLITDIFEERFTMIFNAMKKKHPEITVIGTVGPTFEGTDYREGWDIAKKLDAPIVDEHYYQTPGWFIHNQNFYDRYDRSASKVYLGEYAAHLPGRPNNIETALAEALYLTSLERNGDVVTMASYAPLLAKEGHTQWNPNLIYFNNKSVKPTVGYHVQKLFGTNAGDRYLPSFAVFSENNEAVKLRMASSVVQHSESGDVIVKLVNMLPVIVNATIDLGNIVLSDANATVATLTGIPGDRQAVPVNSVRSVEPAFDATLPPYSLMVIRMKTKKAGPSNKEQ